MSISFIVATECRPTIAATLASIECLPGDEIIVVSDMEKQLHMQGFVRDNPFVTCMHYPAGNNWGHDERNFAMPFAKGQYIAHLDDDDVYVINHRAIMEEALLQHPKRPIIFRMKYKNGQILWSDKTIRCGNIGTPMSLLPNDPARLGKFGPFYGGDLLYVESFAGNSGYSAEDFVWSEETTVLIRPHT